MNTKSELTESPADQATRSLFIHFGNAPGPESELTIETIQKRAGSNSEVLERIMERSVPPQRWGINE